MKVYFDTCSLNRPLDNKAQLRVALEAEAVIGILTRCEAGNITLVSSEVLLLEADRNPHPHKKAYVASILDEASEVVVVNNEIKNRAEKLEESGFRAFDALHIASAESAGVEYFCTCDDQLLRKAIQQPDVTVKVATPIVLAQELYL